MASLIGGIPGLLYEQFVPPEERELRLRNPLPYAASLPGKYAQNLKQIPGMLEYPVSFQEREERGYDPYEGVVSHTLGALPQAAWQAFPFLPIIKDISGLSAQAVSSLSESIANIFNTPEMAVEAGTIQPIVESALSMMAGGKGGRPKGGIWPKGKKGRELENVGRREEKAKRLVTPLIEADAPPKSIDPQEPTPYTQYREMVNQELQASREKKLEYGDLSPNVSNPESTSTSPTKDWRGNWTSKTVPGVELTEQQKTILEDQNKRTSENFDFWNKRVDRLEELSGQLENAESGYRSGDRKWFDRYGRPMFPLKDSILQEDLFDQMFEKLFEDLDVDAEKFFSRATPQEERARSEREQLAEEAIKGKKHKFKTERPIQPAGGVQISDDEYTLGVRQHHFNKDGSLTDSGVKLLREHDIQVKTLAERNRKQASPDEAALGRFAEIKRREEEQILHRLGRLRERERDWAEYRGISQRGRVLDEVMGREPSEMEQEMDRRYHDKLAREQERREYYEGLAGKESEEYMKYLQGELKRIKTGKITGDLESVKGRQTQATKDVGINRHKAPPTWEHYWANLFEMPDTTAEQLMLRVGPDLSGKNLVDAATEVLLEDEIQFIEPLDHNIAKGTFSRFYSHYREYLIEGPERVPLDESQIELRLDRLMDLTRRRYRSQVQRLLLEKGYITEDDTRMRWED